MYCRDWNIDCQLGLSRAYHNHVSFSLYSFLYSLLWGCVGDRVEMVVRVHCGSVLGDEFAVMLKMRPPKQSHNALWQPFRPGVLRTTWLWKCIVGLFWGTNLPSCWKCVPQNRPTMHFHNHLYLDSCAHGCESALWDCFWGRICRQVENASPKTVPQCTLTTSNPVSRATSNQPRFPRRMECRKPPPLHKIWTSQIDSERHI